MNKIKTLKMKNEQIKNRLKIIYFIYNKYLNYSLKNTRNRNFI